VGKDRSFATKVAKAAMHFGKHCSQCGEMYRNVQVVSSEKHPVKGTWRFLTKNVQVCKCNEKDVIG
jgi:hypothetical protein